MSTYLYLLHTNVIVGGVCVCVCDSLFSKVDRETGEIFFHGYSLLSEKAFLRHGRLGADGKVRVNGVPHASWTSCDHMHTHAHALTSRSLSLSLALSAALSLPLKR